MMSEALVHQRLHTQRDRAKTAKPALLPYGQNLRCRSDQDGLSFPSPSFQFAIERAISDAKTGHTRPFRRDLRDNGCHVRQSPRPHLLDHGCRCSACAGYRDESQRWERGQANQLRSPSWRVKLINVAGDGVHGELPDGQCGGWERRDAARVVSLVSRPDIPDLNTSADWAQTSGVWLLAIRYRRLHAAQ